MVSRIRYEEGVRAFRYMALLPGIDPRSWVKAQHIYIYNILINTSSPACYTFPMYISGGSGGPHRVKNVTCPLHDLNAKSREFCFVPQHVFFSKSRRLYIQRYFGRANLSATCVDSNTGRQLPLERQTQFLIQAQHFSVRGKSVFPSNSCISCLSFPMYFWELLPTIQIVQQKHFPPLNHFAFFKSQIEKCSACAKSWARFSSGSYL